MRWERVRAQNVRAPRLSLFFCLSFRIWGAAAGAKQAGYRAAASRLASHGGFPDWALRSRGAHLTAPSPGVVKKRGLCAGRLFTGFQGGLWYFSAQGCEMILLARGAHTHRGLRRG